MADKAADKVADQQKIGEVLKDFAANVTTSKTKERCRILADLEQCLLDNELPDAAVKTLMRYVSIALSRYADNKSRYALRKAIIAISVGQSASGLKHLVMMLEREGEFYKKLAPSASTSAAALGVLSLSVELTKRVAAIAKEDQLMSLINAQIGLLSGALGSERKKFDKAALGKLFGVWKTNPDIIDLYAKALVNKMDNKDPHLIAMAGAIVKYLTSKKDAERVKKFKVDFIQLFVKNVLSASGAVAPHLNAWAKAVLAHATHEDFSGKILAQVNRGLLRNPETSIDTVASLLKNVTIDLSAYCLELLKPLSGQLRSNNDEVRPIAVTAVTNLAKQCSDGQKMKEVAKMLTGVFTGAEGKLTVMAHRISVLEAIGGAATCPIKGEDAVDAILEVIKGLSSSLQTEVTESILVCALQQVRPWCAKVEKQVPNPLVEMLKKGMSLKSSAAPVRTEYYKCMLAAFRGDTLAQGLEMAPICLTSLEKASKQSIQAPLVTEAVLASLLLSNLATLETESEGKLGNFWSVIGDDKKMLVTNEKFLSVASEDTLQHLTLLAERLLFDHASKMKANPKGSRQYHHVLVNNAVSSLGWNLRKQALNSIKKIMMGLGGAPLARALLAEFRKLLLSKRVFSYEGEKPDVGEGGGSDSTSQSASGASGAAVSSGASGVKTHADPVHPRVMANALQAILSVPKDLDKEARTQLAIDCFLDAHHPSIIAFSRESWTTIVATSLGVPPLEVVVDRMEDFVNILFGRGSNNNNNKDAGKEIPASVLSACVWTLALVAPKEFYPRVTTEILQILKNPALKEVTTIDLEIAETPEGELYNLEVIKSSDDEAHLKNVKRENKAYSYKDQMADLKLQKELDEKKGKKRELTPKQKELMAVEIAKEAVVRTRVISLKKQLTPATTVLDSMMDAAASSTTRAMVDFIVGPAQTQIPPLVDALLALVKSPLPAPSAVQSFLKCKDVVLSSLFHPDDPWLSPLFSYVTLRLLEPATDLSTSGWTDEPLKDALQRAIMLLHMRAIGGLKGSRGEQMISILSPAVPLTAPAFAFVFPLLNQVLRDRAKQIPKEKREIALGNCMAIALKHAALRQDEKDAENDDDDDDDDDDADDFTDEMEITGPKFLPRAEMIRLMLDLISRESGKIQADAATCLVEVAKSASGMEGCTEASQREIDLLLAALLSADKQLRLFSLKALLQMQMVLPILDDVDDEDEQPEGVVPKTAEEKEKQKAAALEVIRRVWVAKFDVDEEVAELASTVWTEVCLEVVDELLPLVIRDCAHGEEVIRSAASKALAEALGELPKSETQNLTVGVTDLLLEIYMDKLTIPPVELDDFGRPLGPPPPDPWESRDGVGSALGNFAPLMSNEVCIKVFNFFIPQGLGDRHASVQKRMLTAALAIVEHHGRALMSDLLPILEGFLENAPNTQSYDVVRQGVVVVLGTMAKHLDKDDGRVKPIVGKLIETLSTPSQAVQEAVANCMPPLVPAIKADAPEMTKKLILLLLEADKYGDRRGAAYGLAGLVKGLGILSLKQLDIMTTLTEAIQDKKSQRHREGALFGFEMLCAMLGRLFEPYVVHVLPHLLLCFGDSSQHVRNAADDTARAVMSKLSAHGVKLVLPSLLQALEEDSWRTKTGSVELLGAMAFCAPKQLSSCLPSIVPKLCVVLTDSHPKVAKAGETAIKQIGSVVRNPEIQVIAPHLIDALQNPTKKTSGCLQMLIDTKFVHFIDAASLALVMPVVQRGFQDRSTDTRKMAAQIIGNMYSLTDQKDLAPYLETILPGLKAALLDPVPEVRTVASRALGAMAKGMGESTFGDLLPWLMTMLTSEASSVDRSGAAQGLSEVVGGLGIEKLNSLMPDIVSSAEKADIQPHVRDGYLMMYIYLPSVFQEEFVGFIAQIIPSILQALADEAEFVRDTALKAGQRIVQMYAETAIALFLPELEKGLFDENWRIRYSSVQLLGDLLYRISGVTGKMTTEAIDEDDTFGSEESINCLVKALGAERKNRVLAGLYMGRCDTALQVRQSSLHVWKIVVSNTPRTLREILSTLFSLLLGCLASTSYDKRQVAARTLGDLVRKLGERVLPEIIPILEKGLDCEDRPDQRQGVCIGLSEIIGSTNREHVLTFSDSLVPTVRRALCDTLPEVRAAAAQTFDKLHATIGQRALDDILPNLLDRLSAGDEEDAARALDGLRQVMAVKSRVVLPYLVPQLTSPPVNTHALAILSSVAGDALTKHLPKILPALMSALTKEQGTNQEDVVFEHCQTVVLSVSDDHGVHTVMSELLEATSHESAAIRAAAATLLFAYVSKTKLDYSAYVPNLIRGLVKMFTDDDNRVLTTAWDALNAVTKNLDAAEQLRHVSNVRQAVKYAASDLKATSSPPLLPGFCLPKKGIAPILPIYREGILQGPPDMKELAASGLGEVIKLTSPEALKPSVVHITGPLIRILGDRFSWNVNVAVLETLGQLLAKVGVMLKPFLPQLQTTFLKNLVNPHRSVRLQAASALGQLVVIHQRVDPLFNELIANIKSAEDSGVKDTTLQALRHSVIGAGGKVSEAVRRSVLETLLEIVNDPSGDAADATSSATRMAAAGCLGHLLPFLLPHEKENVIKNHLLDSDSSSGWEVAHGRSVALFVALKAAPMQIVNPQYETKLQEVLLEYITNDRVPVCQSGLRGVCFYFLTLLNPGSCDGDSNGVAAPAVPNSLLLALGKTMNHSSNEIKTLTTSVFLFLAKNSGHPLELAFIKPVMAQLINGTKEKNSAVRASSEQALVALLKLRQGQDHANSVIAGLDAGPRGALNDIMKSLTKVAGQSEPKDEEMDNSIVV